MNITNIVATLEDGSTQVLFPLPVVAPAPEPTHVEHIAPGETVEIVADQVA